MKLHSKTNFAGQLKSGDSYLLLEESKKPSRDRSCGSHILYKKIPPLVHKSLSEKLIQFYLMEINPDLAYISYFKNSVCKHDFFFLTLRS